MARNCIAHVLADGTVNPAWNPDANSSVNALAVSGSTVYVGGYFTAIGGQARSRIAALDATTGLATPWNPSTNNLVRALVVSGSTVFAGGDFITIGGQTRNYIAALDAATGNATAWNPNANSAVHALAVSGSTVYAGGLFTSIGAQSRNSIAALDATTGNATAWNPNANSTVRALAVAGSTVHVGGDFSSVGGESRNRIAALDATTGIATAWNPDANNIVFSLAVSGSTVYAGGFFTTIGGQERSRIAALDTTTGSATAWNPAANNGVYTLVASESTVTAGGVFGSIGGFTRNRLAALDAATGIPTAWNPNPSGSVRSLAVFGSTVYAGGQFTNIGGQARNRIAALNASTGFATSWNPNANLSVYAIEVSGSTVYVGGAFTSIGGQARNRIAALNAATGNATAWNPDASNTVRAIAVSSPTVYAGGQFNSIGGQVRSRIAALSAATGSAYGWNPSAADSVYTLAVSSTTVHAGGIFTSIGGQARNRVAALNATTGLATAWNPNADSTVSALEVSGTTVYAAGDFTSIGGQTRNHIAALNGATGFATAWNPNPDGYVVDLAASGSSVYAVGVFGTIGGLSRRGFAQFDSTLVPASPSNAGAIAIGLTSLTWTWNDNSSDEVGFRVYSDAAINGAPIILRTTTAANVEEWEETGLSPNTPYSLTVVAINTHGASNNSVDATAWTLAQVPAMPALSSATLSTADVAVGGGDGNPSHTTYAIHHGNTTTWVQADGSLDASPVWQTAEEWDTLTVTGLASATLHNFAVRARNGAGVETANGPSASIGTDATLDYTAGANGSLSGDAAQVVAYNGSGTAVTAVPDAGYTFIDWSDASTDNPRTDTNVTANVVVTANFADQAAPTSTASASGIQIGGDLTGTYVADDTGSGVASVALYAKEPGGNWTNVGAVTGGTWAFTPTQAGDAGDGLYRFATVATDVAANSGTAPAGNDPGDVATLYNDVANSNFAHTFAADGTAQFPMTASEVMEIALTGVTAPVTITVSRTVGDVAPSGMMAERLIDESLSITGALAGASATITWNYDPASTDAPGFVTTLDTVFQFNGATPVGEYAVTPAGNSITFGPVTSFSDWFAGSNDASVADWMMLTD